MKPIIKVEGLGKRYRLGESRAGYGTLREALAGALRAPLKGWRRAGEGEAVWALKDLSFEVRPGEIVGILGHNGAGKSTLLKILSRVTEPTEGRARLYGRVGSLLEVGTGFHPELSGRENIYLNGSILGMKRAEIDAKFDEIVAFSEIERFLDTPVKRYSSGMYMRLAFAVAAHLEPEILLVDEVLAVGDAAFQKKCLGKMGEVAREGRTVLFVSHSLGSLLNLCPRAMLIAGGQKTFEGATSDAISEYIASGGTSEGERVWDDPATAPGNDKVRLHAVRIVSGGEVAADVDIQKETRVEIDYWTLRPDARVTVGIHLLDKMGYGVLSSANMHSANLGTDEWFDRPHPVGLYRTTCALPGNFLNEGVYYINAVLLTNVIDIEVMVNNAVSFNVHESGAMRKEYGGYWLGVVRPKLDWRSERLGSLEETAHAGGAS